MHGRPRKALKPQDATKSIEKGQKLRALQSQFLSNHHNRIYTKEALEISAKLLETNPEYYTAWNYRKLAVEYNVNQSESDPEAIKSIFDEELRLVESALRQNFKSYGAWHHRRWVLSKGHSSLDQELRLLDKFQKADSRNFHAWNYRRFVASLLNRSVDDELKYIGNMIDINFSNYSAWHNRSILLSEKLNNKDCGLSYQEILSQEYDYVRAAIFTEPTDQSGWFYHLWLLEQTVKAETPLLMSSWPPHGSHLTVSRYRCQNDQGLTLLSGLYFDLKTFPLVLHFNHAVQGISSSTVIISPASLANESFTWKPLSPANSQSSQVWVASLNVSAVECDTLGPITVEVSLGHCQGITSSSGSPYMKSLRLTFTVSIESVEMPSYEGKNTNMVSWSDDNFSTHEAHLQGSNSILSFYRQKAEDNIELTHSGWHVDTITEEIGQYKELLEMGDYKIGKLTLARLLMALDAMSYGCASNVEHLEEVLGLYRDLVDIDPTHSQYYKDEISLVLWQQLTSSKGSLLRHCYCHKGINSLGIQSPICLRLNNLSLSRLGSFEKLLWVQMVDLSNNELHSIEGLEALQLLSHLNLRSNKLGSFAALEPLRSLKCLKVLDISNNEIGSHSIDTRRYLFSSPLSHSSEIDWSRDELVKGVDVINYWEAYIILKELNLIQLDITGNVVADEQFKSFLLKILPAIQWLDGEKLL